MTSDTQATETILHHYDSSPFSEKVRLVLGLKRLPWRSVVISNIMPRPDLMPMTGGYRRTPVMQIGADIYCDSAIIVRELERRFPETMLFPAGTAGASWALTVWSDRAFFPAAVAVIFGGLPDGALPESFLRDREALTGRKFDVAGMRAAVPYMRDQWRAHAHLVEVQLRAQRERDSPWLLGDRPSWADITAHMNFWFLRGASPAFAEMTADLPLVLEWLGLVDGLGHGRREEMKSAEALAIARCSDPLAPLPSKPAPGEPGLGEVVAVAPDDYGRVPVVGELVHLSPERVSIRRQDDQAGEVVVHFPRLGFSVTSVSS